MTITEQTYTLAEFMALPEAGTRYELIHGRLVEMPGPSYRHGKTIGNLYAPLFLYAQQNNLGDVLTNTAYNFDPAHPNHAPVPDFAFILAANRSRIKDYDNAIPFAPDLTVETVSRTDKWFDVREKIREFLHFGTQIAWLISPPDSEIYIYRNDGTAQVLTAKDTLTGETLIPGFSIAVADVFKIP